MNFFDKAALALRGITMSVAQIDKSEKKEHLRDSGILIPKDGDTDDECNDDDDATDTEEDSGIADLTEPLRKAFPDLCHSDLQSAEQGSALNNFFNYW